MTIVQIIVICLACLLLFGRLFFGVFKRFSPFDLMRNSGDTSVDKSDRSNGEAPIEDENNNNNTEASIQNYQPIEIATDTNGISNNVIDENRVRIKEPSPLKDYQSVSKASDIKNANDGGATNSNDLSSNNRFQFQYQRTRRANTTTGIYDESKRRTYAKHSNNFISVRD
jgi:hypothetical protein